MESSGSSLSLIIPSPVSSSILAPNGLLRTTVKPSSASGTVSSRVGTKIVRVVSPAAKVSLPEAAV